MTDSNARQSETQLWFYRRARVSELVKAWHDGHRDRWEPWPELVQIAIKAAVTELAQQAVNRRGGVSRMAPFGKPRFDKMMRALVCQLRLKRFGPIEHLSGAEWQAQVEAIASELGWEWVDGKERDLPMPQRDQAKAA